MFSAKQWLAILLSGGATAFVFGLALTGSLGGIFLSNFAQFPLFVVALGLGATGAMISAGVSLVVLVGAGLAAGLPTLLVMYLAPTVFLARRALLNRADGQGGVEWYPPGHLVMWSSGIAAALLTAGFLFLAGEPGGVEGVLRDTLDQAFAKLLPKEQQEQRQLLVDVVVPLLPGISAALWILVIATNAALAQWLLIGVRRNVRPTPDIAAVVLPRWLAYACGGAVLAGIFLPDTPGYFGRNFAIVLAVPYFFAGLGVLHFLSRRHPAGSLLLALFYLFLLLFSLFIRWPVLAVTAVGLLDQWTGLRQRLHSGGPD